MNPKTRALHKIAARYLVPTEVLSRLERTPERLGIDTAFETNSTMDRTVPSKMPEPSTVNAT
jgi:hypothetical protein